MNKKLKETETGGFNQGKSKLEKKSIINCSPSPFDFVYMCLMVVFKKFVFSQTHIKIGLYFAALFVCSIIKDFNLLNQSHYFTQKNNFFNQYFVKIGWGWTLLVCFPFISMTTCVYTGFSLTSIIKHLSRLVVSTVIWYVFTTAFEIIDSNTGKCTNPVWMLKKDCKKNKHDWIGFDISGHTFLLMYCLLIMLEEVKIFDQWDQYYKKIQEKLANAESDSKQNLEKAIYWFKIFTPLLKVNFFIMAILALIFEVMLLSTFLYFHTIIHKMLAAFCAIICWFLTYKLWYLLPMSPGLPGDNSLIR